MEKALYAMHNMCTLIVKQEELQIYNGFRGVDYVYLFQGIGEDKKTRQLYICD